MKFSTHNGSNGKWVASAVEEEGIETVPAHQESKLAGFAIKDNIVLFYQGVDGSVRSVAV